MGLLGFGVLLLLGSFAGAQCGMDISNVGFQHGQHIIESVTRSKRDGRRCLEAFLLTVPAVIPWKNDSSGRHRQDPWMVDGGQWHTHGRTNRISSDDTDSDDNPVKIYDSHKTKYFTRNLCEDHPRRKKWSGIVVGKSKPGKIKVGPLE